MEKERREAEGVRRAGSEGGTSSKSLFAAARWPGSMSIRRGSLRYPRPAVLRRPCGCRDLLGPGHRTPLLRAGATRWPPVHSGQL